MEDCFCVAVVAVWIGDELCVVVGVCVDRLQHYLDICVVACGEMIERELVQEIGCCYVECLQLLLDVRGSVDYCWCVVVVEVCCVVEEVGEVGW